MKARLNPSEFLGIPNLPWLTNSFHERYIAQTTLSVKGLEWFHSCSDAEGRDILTSSIRDSWSLGLAVPGRVIPFFFHQCTIASSIVLGTDLILAHKTLYLWVISIFPIAQDAPAQLAFLEL